MSEGKKQISRNGITERNDTEGMGIEKVDVMEGRVVTRKEGRTG